MTGTGTLSGSEVVAGIIFEVVEEELLVVDGVCEVLVRFGSGEVIGDFKSFCGGVDIVFCLLSVDGRWWKLKWFGWGDALMRRVFCQAVTR